MTNGITQCFRYLVPVRGKPFGKQRRRVRSTEALVLFIVCLVLLVLSQYINIEFLGYSLSGWAWVAILLLSMMRIILHLEAVTFPLWIWAPWVGYVLVHAFRGYEFAWQSTAQIVCPVIAAVAASTYRLRSAEINRIHHLIRRAFWAYYAGVVLLVAFPGNFDFLGFAGGTIRALHGFAGGAISALFFQSVFLANYLLNGRRARDLICYLLAVSVPVVSANRGPLAASVGLLVFAILPIRFRHRILLLSLAAMVGVVAFYNPTVQHKMFFSGHGTLSELRYDNKDLNTDGRIGLWTVLISGMDEAFWVGHGGNADRTWLLNHGAATYLPHNDWLRIGFNYGIVGVLLYVLSMAAQICHIRPLMRSSDPGLNALVASAASSFIPYVLVMSTDNVLIYCQAFTVPMMILVGASYAAQRSRYSGRARLLTNQFYLSPMARDRFAQNQTTPIA